MLCPKCKKEIDDNSIECPECGVIISKAKNRPLHQHIIEHQEPPPEKKVNPKLRKCPDCGGDLSFKAQTCPHCGLVLPKQNGCIGCLTLFVVLFVVVWGYDKYTTFMNAPTPEAKVQQAINDEKQKIERERQRAEYNEKCKTDLNCWADKHSLKAIYAADKTIERMAKYQFEWTDGVLEPKISRYRWLNIKNLTVTYLGDKIKMQNGFGAWQNMIYEIDYDPVNEKVLDIRLRNGRF